jgi:hypothetical protein
MAVGFESHRGLRYSRSRRESEPADEGLLVSSTNKDACLELLGGLHFLCSPWGEMLVAGSCRSFPQDSRNSYQIYVVKRMIRGLGVETTLTYSQTLNM